MLYFLCELNYRSVIFELWVSQSRKNFKYELINFIFLYNILKSSSIHNYYFFLSAFQITEYRFNEFINFSYRKPISINILNLILQHKLTSPFADRIYRFANRGFLQICFFQTIVTKIESDVKLLFRNKNFVARTW